MNISEKVRKIMHEGIRGKKVKVKQAVAVAYSMAGRAKKMRKKMGKEMGEGMMEDKMHG